MHTYIPTYLPTYLPTYQQVEVQLLQPRIPATHVGHGSGLPRSETTQARVEAQGQGEQKEEGEVRSGGDIGRGGLGLSEKRPSAPEDEGGYVCM